MPLDGISKTIMLTLATALLFAPQATPRRPAWTEPHPEIPYLAKPPIQAANWLLEAPPVSPDATPEARALLRMLYRISGKGTVLGQHNYPNEQGFATNVMAIFSGKTPALYGTDLGFAVAGDKDSAYVRHQNVAELTRRFRAGQIIALCWHEVPPTMDEPVTFRGEIQSRLTETQFNDLLTPGTAVHKHWLAQLDAAAEMLKELQDAHVPVLWRPLHEINGDWFWWNGVRGDDAHGTKQLYRMVFDRLVGFHHLRNLLWVWNPDQPARADRQFVDYFPGLNVVDVLGLDCYGAFQQSFYDDLNALSGGKVMAIAETSNPPAPSVYATQPKWAYAMRWAMDKAPGQRMIDSLKSPSPPPAASGRRGPSRPEVQALANDPRMLSLQDKAYLAEFNEVLKAAGYPAVRRAEKVPEKL